MRAAKTTDVKPQEDLRLAIPIKPTKAKRAVARIVESFITTDSVVASATIVTDNTTRRIEVDWGDGKNDVINHRPGLLMRNLPVNGDDPLPSGTYQVHHIYDVSEDGRPFDHSVLLRVDDRNGGVDFRIHKITITPRYKVTHYPMTVRLKHGCDPAHESENEFNIQQTVSGNLQANQWDWYPSNNFFGTSQSFRLEGSGVTREFERPPIGEGGGSQAISFEFTEKDWIWDDLIRIYLFIGLDHRGYEGYFSERIEDEAYGDGCTIIYSYSKEMELIVPLPTRDRAVFSSEILA